MPHLADRAARRVTRLGIQHEVVVTVALEGLTDHAGGDVAVAGEGRGEVLDDAAGVDARTEAEILSQQRRLPCRKPARRDERPSER